MRWNRKELKLEADTQHNLSINQSVHWSFITSSGSLSLPSWTRPNMITNNQSGLVHPPPPPATDLLDILIQANRSWLRPHRKHLADITDEDITSQVKRSNRTASTVCVCVYSNRQTDRWVDRCEFEKQKSHDSIWLIWLAARQRNQIATNTRWLEKKKKTPKQKQLMPRPLQGFNVVFRTRWETGNSELQQELYLWGFRDASVEWRTQPTNQSRALSHWFKGHLWRFFILTRVEARFFIDLFPFKK